VVLAIRLSPCLLPGARVYCPLHFFPTKWFACPLSIIERLRLHQLPLSFDSLFGSLEPDKGLPFKDSPAPDLFTSIFCQLWGVVGGGYRLDLRLEEANKLEGETEEVVDKGSRPDVKPALPEYQYPHILPPEICQHPANKLTHLPYQSDRAMTVSARPEIHLVEDAKVSKDGGRWQFDFGDGFGCRVGTRNTGALTDKDTVTSVASEETLRRCGGLEDRKQGGPVLYNLGPLFAVGDESMSDVGKHGLQRAFVLRADHPKYQLRLENGSTIGTSMHESWLWP
jgi:hypothetical protein